MKKKLLAAMSAAALAMTMATNMFSYAMEPLYHSFKYNNTNDFLYALENDFDESFFEELYGKESQRLESFIADAETYGVYIPYVSGEDLSEKGFNMYAVDMFDRTNLYFQGDKDETGIQYLNESLINDELKEFAQENGISALMHQLAPSLEYDASYETTYTIGGNDYNVLVAPFEDDPRIFVFLLHENALFRIALYEETATANSTLEHLTFQQVRLDSKTEAFDEENFFVVVGTSGGYTQLRYFGSNSAEKVIWEDAPEGLSYGDVFTAKGDISLIRVRSAPNDPANAMTYHYKLGEGTELTKVGNCTELMEQRELTVTDTTYDGSSHWSIHLMDQDGNEYRYGLNTFGSYLWVNPLADIGEVFTYAFYKGDLVVPLAKKDAVVIPGDVNGDGVLSISDIALLGKWLLGRPGIQLPNWKAADLCEDDKLDVYDLCLMKKALLEGAVIEPEIPDVLFGYEKEEEHEYPTLTTTQKLALKCKAFCPAGETLKVDAAMGDLSLHDDEWDYDYEISSSDYFTKKDLIVNGEQGEYIKIFPKEEWENLDISGKEGEFDLYHHETSEIDFSGYETGSSGCIEFFFVVRHIGGSHTGMIQRMYFYVGEKGTAISNLSVEDAKENYQSVWGYHDEYNSGSEKMTIDDLRELALKCDDLTWDDFARFQGENIGSGRAVVKYEFEDNDSAYLLVCGTETVGKPEDILLVSNDSKYLGEYEDIRSEEAQRIFRNPFWWWNEPEDDETNRAAAKKIGDFALEGLKNGKYSLDTVIYSSDAPEMMNKETAALLNGEVFHCLSFVDEHTVLLRMNKGLLDAYGYLITDGSVTYKEKECVYVPNEGYDGNEVYIEWAGENLYYFWAGT